MIAYRAGVCPGRRTRRQRRRLRLTIALVLVAPPVLVAAALSAALVIRQVAGYAPTDTGELLTAVVGLAGLAMSLAAPRPRRPGFWRELRRTYRLGAFAALSPMIVPETIDVVR